VVVLLLAVALIYTSERSLSRPKAGLLMAASFLLAPYAAGNSLLSILAIGVIPVLIEKPQVGLPLILVYNIPYFFPPPIHYFYGALYATSVAFFTSAALGWYTINSEIIRPFKERELDI
jgi:hypothetical protein